MILGYLVVPVKSKDPSQAEEKARESRGRSNAVTGWEPQTKEWGTHWKR